MSAFSDSIRSGPPRKRLFAFLVGLVIVTTPAILTSIFKKSDCSILSDQNARLMQNQAKMAAVNGELVNQNTSQLMDLIKIQELLAKIDKRKTTVTTDSVIRKKPDAIAKTATYSPESGVYKSIEGWEKPIETKTIIRVKTIKKMPEQNRLIVDSVLLIASKWKIKKK